MLMRVFNALGVLGIVAWCGVESRLDLRYEYFQDRNDVVSHTPVLSWITNLPKNLVLQWDQEVDAVSGASRMPASSASMKDVSPIIDAISGASTSEFRIGESTRLSYNSEGHVLGVNGSFSYEDDYRSYSPGVFASWDFNQRNTTLGGSYQHFFDDFKSRTGFPAGGKKSIDSWSLSLAQSLTKTTLVAGGINLIQSNGYLGKPYTPVRLGIGPMEGALVPENLPNNRSAIALSGQIVQGFRLVSMLGSCNLSYRFYNDSWGILSHTGDFKMYQHFNDNGYVRLRYRQYWQRGAAFIQENYDGTEEYHSVDLRFFPFNSRLYGIKVQVPMLESWIEATELVPDTWSFSIDATTRDTRDKYISGVIALELHYLLD